MHVICVFYFLNWNFYDFLAIFTISKNKKIEKITKGLQIVPYFSKISKQIIYKSRLNHKSNIDRNIRTPPITITTSHIHTP